MLSGILAMRLLGDAGGTTADDSADAMRGEAGEAGAE
jgi:hypothetical protein